MTTTPPIINEAEGLIHRLAALLTRPRARECLACCDCEVLLNAYEPVLEPADDVDGVDELPPCAGVRRGSVTPCSNWRRIRLPW